MSALSAIVVDDEERARRRLHRMLGAMAEVEVVGEASSGAEAVALLARLRPDIVFLDVQMPDCDGFAVLAQLGRPPRYVVFTTAYDRYALDAFAVGALDYLLKPFGEEEVRRAVRRAAEQQAEQRFREGYAELVQALARPHYLDRIPVLYQHDIVLVPVSIVTHFVADRELVAMHAGAVAYTTELTLAELESRLDPERFFRAHRRAIINLDKLLRIGRIEGGRLLAILGDDVRIEISRTASRALRAKLGI